MFGKLMMRELWIVEKYSDTVSIMVFGDQPNVIGNEG